MSLTKTELYERVPRFISVSVFIHYLVLCGLSCNLRAPHFTYFIQVLRFLNSKLVNVLTLLFVRLCVFVFFFRKLVFLFKETSAHIHTHSDTHIHTHN